MIRVSEMVLPGHPDKFCDQVADAIIAACVAVDPHAYGQVEAAAWSDRVWLSGSVCMRVPLKKSLASIVVKTGRDLGYRDGNWIDARKYRVDDTVCQLVDEPDRWSAKVNDQSIVIGWAGYDAKTAYLPPEHYAAHAFRDALARSCKSGLLAGEGPDGKLLVRMREDAGGWSLEHLLVTLQQREATAFMDLCESVIEVLRVAYEELQERDPRWRAKWNAIELMINPNGPLVNGGSDGDNGQTGRKLVMDFYGPRVPLGGGALSGKHMTHIDRIGSYAARHAAVEAVASGASECLVRLTYAPNRPQPLDVFIDAAGSRWRPPQGFFDHGEMTGRYRPETISAEMARGTHFFDRGLAWNRAGAEGVAPTALSGASRAKELPCRQ